MVNNYICPPYNTSGMLRQDYNPFALLHPGLAKSEALRLIEPHNFTVRHPSVPGHGQDSHAMRRGVGVSPALHSAAPHGARAMVATVTAVVTVGSSFDGARRLDCSGGGVFDDNRYGRHEESPRSKMR